MTDELFSVRGKRFFVTGGASGVGRMITEGLAERGARVFTCGRKQESIAELLEDLKEKRGLDVTAEPADLAKVSEIERITARVSAHFGGELDVLVNNAGATWGAPIDEYPETGWDKVMDLDVKSLFFTTQKCLPLLRKAAKKLEAPSRVINVGSISGIHFPLDDAWAYHPAKAAVHHLTGTLAKKLAPEGINVNAIAPGLFPSKMTAYVMPGGDTSGVSQFIPAGRVGRPSDIAGTVIYLASAAGAYTTGATIKVDGGSALS
ncbi:MAG TPA: SDR family oxidoreductase [Polyangiales bacterium]|jgi:NAD(P)-dependent dehydrogenase (short-subunit alcohol dehydrogenase family)|nr:SDR family oxidoreductase [Polyangiales bacterium]